jgi:hypothetical protein
MISYVAAFLSTPSWWMPLSCAKALRPTMALLGCTSNPVIPASILERRRICSVRMPVRYGTRSWRTRKAITASSSAALPARSPMPLIVHSTWRTPARIAASVFATARPRSLWLCVDRITPSAPGTRSRSIVKIAPMSSGSA